MPIPCGFPGFTIPVCLLLLFVLHFTSVVNSELIRKLKFKLLSSNCLDFIRLNFVIVTAKLSFSVQPYFVISF